jgi:hypothetical protein
MECTGGMCSGCTFGFGLLRRHANPVQHIGDVLFIPFLCLFRYIAHDTYEKHSTATAITFITKCACVCVCVCVCGCAQWRSQWGVWRCRAIDSVRLGSLPGQKSSRGPKLSAGRAQQSTSTPSRKLAAMSLDERLSKIRDNPKLQGQQQVPCTCLFLSF